MDVTTAFAKTLGDLPQPAVSSYQLGVVLLQLYQKKEYRQIPLNRLQKDIPDRRDLRHYVVQLEGFGVLEHSQAINHHEVYVLLGRKNAPVADIACSIDPFAYVSHLSAMEHHGLTDQIPKILYLSTPAPRDWRAFADERMTRDIGQTLRTAHRDAGLPQLRRIELKQIRRTPVHRHTSSHLGAFTRSNDTPRRVATLGRTFLDMIREPDLCGGIHHVMEVYEEHAATYRDLITAEVDQHGRAIDKMRAGYLLDELCGLSDERIESWQALAQRGGSRKLYAKNEYAAEYSEKWQISINVL